MQGVQSPGIRGFERPSIGALVDFEELRKVHDETARNRESWPRAGKAIRRTEQQVLALEGAA